MPKIIDAEPIIQKLENAMADTDGVVRATIAAFIHLLKIQPEIQQKKTAARKPADKCKRCIYRLVCKPEQKASRGCEDYAYDPTTERSKTDGKKKQTKKKKTGSDSGNGGHLLPSDNGRDVGRFEGAGAGCGQADADVKAHHEGNAKGMLQGRQRPKSDEGRQGRIRVTKEIDGLYDHCCPQCGAEYDATLYTADLSRNRRHPNCVIVCGGKRVILRQGEYEIIGGKEDG